MHAHHLHAHTHAVLRKDGITEGPLRQLPVWLSIPAAARFAQCDKADAYTRLMYLTRKVSNPPSPRSHIVWTSICEGQAGSTSDDGAHRLETSARLRQSVRPAPRPSPAAHLTPRRRLRQPAEPAHADIGQAPPPGSHIVWTSICGYPSVSVSDDGAHPPRSERIAQAISQACAAAVTRCNTWRKASGFSGLYSTPTPASSRRCRSSPSRSAVSITAGTSAWRARN